MGNFNKFFVNFKVAKITYFLNGMNSPRRGIGSSRRNYTSGLRWPRVLDAFPSSAHPTPLAKVNASPPTNLHYPPDDFHHVYFFPLYFYFIVTLSFLMIWLLFADVIVFALNLMHQLRLFVCLCILRDLSWVSNVTWMPRRPLNYQINK